MDYIPEYFLLLGFLLAYSWFVIVYIFNLINDYFSVLVKGLLRLVNIVSLMVYEFVLGRAFPALMLKRTLALG